MKKLIQDIVGNFQQLNQNISFEYRNNRQLLENSLEAFQSSKIKKEMSLEFLGEKYDINLKLENFSELNQRFNLIFEIYNGGKLLEKYEKLEFLPFPGYEIRLNLKMYQKIIMQAISKDIKEKSLIHYDLKKDIKIKKIQSKIKNQKIFSQLSVDNFYLANFSTESGYSYIIKSLKCNNDYILSRQEKEKNNLFIFDNSPIRGLSIYKTIKNEVIYKDARGYLITVTIKESETFKEKLKLLGLNMEEAEIVWTFSSYGKGGKPVLYNPDYIKIDEIELDIITDLQSKILKKSIINQNLLYGNRYKFTGNFIFGTNLAIFFDYDDEKIIIKDFKDGLNEFIITNSFKIFELKTITTEQNKIYENHKKELLNDNPDLFIEDYYFDFNVIINQGLFLQNLNDYVFDCIEIEKSKKTFLNIFNKNKGIFSFV